MWMIYPRAATGSENLSAGSRIFSQKVLQPPQILDLVFQRMRQRQAVHFLRWLNEEPQITCSMAMDDRQRGR